MWRIEFKPCSDAEVDQVQDWPEDQKWQASLQLKRWAQQRINRECAQCWKHYEDFITYLEAFRRGENDGFIATIEGDSYIIRRLIQGEGLGDLVPGSTDLADPAGTRKSQAAVAGTGLAGTGTPLMTEFVPEGFRWQYEVRYMDYSMWSGYDDDIRQGIMQSESAQRNNWTCRRRLVSDWEDF